MSAKCPTTVKRFQFYACLGACLLAGLLTGCGSGEPFSYVKVNGKVSYDDGTPIPAKRIQLIFITQTVQPVDAKTSPPQGKADVTSADGKFDVVTSHTYDDGLLAGKHKVMVIPKDETGRPVEGLVPKEYRELGTTPIEIDTANLPLEIKVKKPGK
ncbi:MAG TPA: hypothetical protein VG056_17665 [Pirellulales bacterium]|jgi:hypothetical protein|nr:hypothetical protein [Pirellulales bacterium]